MEKRVSLREIDFLTFATTLTILAFGLIMVFSASSWSAALQYGDSMYFFKKQAIFAVLGIVSMIILMSYDYHKLARLSKIMFFATMPLLLLTHLFPASNGAHRWIYVGSQSIQPSEIMKYALVIYFAHRMASRGDEIKTLVKGVLFYLLMVGIVAALLLTQPNMSIAAVCIFVTFIMLYVGGARLKDLAKVVLPVFLGLVVLILTSTYRRTRLFSFMNPFKEATGAGYQLVQSFLALGSGGVVGVGLGFSRQKALYMPEPYNDFILSIIGEELGLIGCVFVLVLFVILLYRGIKIATTARDDFGALLAIGITGIIIIQALINVAVVTGSMPVTGVPLPFISYGGTALFINLSAIGVLLNISRQCKKAKSVGRKIK